MHNFVVQTNEITCRKGGRLGMDQVISLTERVSPMVYTIQHPIIPIYYIYLKTASVTPYHNHRWVVEF